MKHSKEPNSEKGLHEPLKDNVGKTPLPILEDEAQGQHSNGKAKDMSHVESYVDSLDDEEATHAHNHLTKRLHPAALENPKDKGVTMDDYAKVMQGEA